MPRLFYNVVFVITFMLTVLLPNSSTGQDLDPRAYIHVPVNVNLFISGFAFSSGGIVTDATLPVKNLNANVESPSVGYMRTFSFFGKTASAFAAIPYSFAQVSADVAGQPDRTTRSGFADMRLRMSVLLIGGPAATLTQFGKPEPKTILGVSINAIAPNGQYFDDKLINLGTNRWAFRPELALSHPLSKRWLMDIYTGVWLFTNNNRFYTGKSMRTQNPMMAIQGHLSYNVKFGMWLAFDATYFAGGQSTIDGQLSDDRRDNSRLGITLVLPVTKTSSLKLAGSTGVIIRSGADFSTISVGWQTTWWSKKQMIRKTESNK